MDYIKGAEPMDQFKGFKVLTRQIHPQSGEGVMLVEADKMAAFEKHTYPWTKGLGLIAKITPGLSARSTSSLRKECKQARLVPSRLIPSPVHWIPVLPEVNPAH